MEVVQKDKVRKEYSCKVCNQSFNHVGNKSRHKKKCIAKAVAKGKMEMTEIEKQSKIFVV